MRFVKILLIFLLVIVSTLYAMTTLSNAVTGKDSAPTISCSSDHLELSVTDSENVLLTGITAADGQDGNLTSKVRISGISKFIKDHTAKVTYVVFDSDHNMAQLTRYITYTDYESPRFAITEPLIYYQSESIALLDRLEVIDCIDGDITDSVRVSTLSSTSDPETYSITVQVTNSMGDTTQLVLPVIQMTGIAIRPEVHLTDYLIYLSQGSSFNAKSYLSYVETPDGRGDKDDVRIVGTVDTATPGTYTVRYTYPYESTSGSAILTVVVE